MKNKSLIAVIAALVIVIIAAAVVYPELSEKATEEINNTEAATATEEANNPYAAPDIRLFNAEGEEVMLSDFRGKPVILNFWATWCGYCIREMPDFEEAYKEYGDEIQFLIVNTDDGIEKGEKYIKDNSYTFPTFYDLELDAAITYGITGIPRTIALDKDGNICYNRSGMINAATLEAIIQTIR